MVLHVAPGPGHISSLASPLGRLITGSGAMEVPQDFLLPLWQVVLATSTLPRCGPTGQDGLPAYLGKIIFVSACLDAQSDGDGGSRSSSPGGSAPPLVPGVPQHTWEVTPGKKPPKIPQNSNLNYV